MAEQITSEDYANLVEIVSWINQAAIKTYPDATPLRTDQLQFVRNLSVLEQSRAENTLHPFFLRKFSDHMQFFGPSEGSWVYPEDNTIYFGWKNIDDMRKDKRVGYFGIGLDSAGASVVLGTQPVIVESDKASRLATDILKANYRVSFAGLANDQDLQEALEFMEKQGSAIAIRGMTLALICEGKLFLPRTAITDDALLSTYLSRPIKVDYARMLIHEFSLTTTQRANIMAHIENYVPAEASMVSNPKQAEKDLLARLANMGFEVTRSKLVKAYQSGEIGKQLVENHPTNT